MRTDLPSPRFRLDRDFDAQMWLFLSVFRAQIAIRMGRSQILEGRSRFSITALAIGTNRPGNPAGPVRPGWVHQLCSRVPVQQLSRLTQ
ncbi:MAG TPA: hypothetical protein VF163_11040 [Micromonosporaceae bacterium]